MSGLAQQAIGDPGARLRVAEVGVTPRISNSGLRSASASAKASSMSSPISVSMMTFSRMSAVEDAWAKPSFVFHKLAQTTQMRNSVIRRMIGLASVSERDKDYAGRPNVVFGAR